MQSPVSSALEKRPSCSQLRNYDVYWGTLKRNSAGLAEPSKPVCILHLTLWRKIQQCVVRIATTLKTVFDVFLNWKMARPRFDTYGSFIAISVSIYNDTPLHVELVWMWLITRTPYYVLIAWFKTSIAGGNTSYNVHYFLPACNLFHPTLCVWHFQIGVWKHRHIDNFDHNQFSVIFYYAKK